MSSRRVSRVQDQVREEISKLLLFKIKDPRLQAVSVIGVKMSADLKRAVVYYSTYGDPADRPGIKEGLKRAGGFFRREIGRALALKFVPEIVFEYDDSIEYMDHMNKLIGSLTETSSGENSGAGENSGE